MLLILTIQLLKHDEMSDGPKILISLKAFTNIADQMAQLLLTDNFYLKSKHF